MNPDPSKFYDTEEAAILGNISEHGLRKILRGKKDGRKLLIGQKIRVNNKTQWFIEKWVYHLFLHQEVIRFQKHVQHLQDSLNNPEEQIRNGRKQK